MVAQQSRALDALTRHLHTCGVQTQTQLKHSYTHSKHFLKSAQEDWRPSLECRVIQMNQVLSVIMVVHACHHSTWEDQELKVINGYVEFVACLGYTMPSLK